MEQLLGQHVDLAQIRKIGEGTFGEAFKASGIVLKIVPMEGEFEVSSSAGSFAGRRDISGRRDLRAGA
jgi:hypothetical protein